MQLFVHIMLTVTSCSATSVGTVPTVPTDVAEQLVTVGLFIQHVSVLLPYSPILIFAVNVTLQGFMAFGYVLLGTHQLDSHLSCVETDIFACFLDTLEKLRNVTISFFKSV